MVVFGMDMIARKQLYHPQSLALCESKSGAHQRYTPIAQTTPSLIKTVMQAIKQYPEFVTITCLDWKHVLQREDVKDIITQSLSFLVNQERILVFAFVIMSNHMHLIWQMVGDHTRENVQRDFLKYTSQQILKLLKSADSLLFNELVVNAKDRKHQVWKRDSLAIPIWSDSVLWQKLDYIHANPVKAGLCSYATEYRYSSASFYFEGKKHWGFLSHVNG